MKALLCVAALLFFCSLIADELTIDPPLPWPVECQPCGPGDPCPPCIPEIQEIEDQVILDLIDPLYQDGVLTTDQGGVLTSPDLRIQARKIIYRRDLDSDAPTYWVYCEGDLLVDFRNRTLSGERLYYNFLTHTGVLIQGKTASPPWYVGGEKVILKQNGEIEILNGYITTNEINEKDIALVAPRITIREQRLLTAYNLNFRIKGVPVFWLPKTKIDLKSIGRSPLAVRFGWGGFLGSYIGLRYRFLSWNDFNGFARIDGYFGKGMGGGIETEYNPKCSPVEFYTRSYFARDIPLLDRNRRNRWRYQGTYYNEIFYDSITVDLMYDVVSDAQMASEYQSKDFDLKTAQRTYLKLRTEKESWIGSMFTQVRVNDFQTVNQHLPVVDLSWRPYVIGDSGIIAENRFKAGYLNYVFGDRVKNANDFSAGRFEIHPRIYRPFYLGPIIATPEAGFIGIGYTDSNEGRGLAQTIGEFKFNVETSISKVLTPCVKHVIEPYSRYTFLTTPGVSVDDPFIFTINDAYKKLNLLRFGCRNALYQKVGKGIVRPLYIDLWSNAFFDLENIPQVIQKGYANVELLPYDRLFIGMESSWNFAHQQLDFWNTRADWTLSERLALGVEYRHRGHYDWRKSDFYNFILEAARPERDLLRSPLSNPRNLIIGRAFYRLNPNWDLRVQLRQGWEQKFGFRTKTRHLPSYFEYLGELSTVVFEHWRVNFIYERRVEENRYSFSVKLNPGPPPKRKCK